ncbi:hypothetical protein SAMD00019534_029550, partial [Acytostelium subglobosum LB1]|uniref:hypothetical protein n=1 Tax=Acytostelium subglobosum LB1 TaxID=1410327 RepID=UPI000644FFC7
LSYITSTTTRVACKSGLAITTLLAPHTLTHSHTIYYQPTTAEAATVCDRDRLDNLDLLPSPPSSFELILNTIQWTRPSSFPERQYPSDPYGKPYQSKQSINQSITIHQSINQIN